MYKLQPQEMHRINSAGFDYTVLLGIKITHSNAGVPAFLSINLARINYPLILPASGDIPARQLIV